MSSLSSVSNTHKYLGNSEINFNQDELFVTIDTNRLHMRSIQSTDFDHYISLFEDKNVMEKFGNNGKTLSEEEIEIRINDIWINRWHNKDPYSGLSIFKSDTNDFIGHIVLGHGDEPGESELAYLFHQKYWGKGYGSEAVNAVVKEYAQATIKENYKLEGKQLKKIVAYTKSDNPASVKILKKAGMHLDSIEERYESIRHKYSITINTLTKSNK